MDSAIELASICRISIHTGASTRFLSYSGTLSTTMYYTGLDPLTMEQVYVQNQNGKALQRALLQYRDPKKYDLVYAALKSGRTDLAGYGQVSNNPELKI